MKCTEFFINFLEKQHYVEKNKYDKKIDYTPMDLKNIILSEDLCDKIYIINEDVCLTSKASYEY
jgi:hypothetical protein